MAAIVVPFHLRGKTRLDLPEHTRRELALAMLGDVLAACTPVGATHVVTDDGEAAALALELGAAPIEDPGGGQGAAVAAALAGREVGPIVVVNADVPAVVPQDLRALLAATPAGGIALVPAADGTTNAVSVPAPQVFAPLFGPGSAARFLEHARGLGLEGVAVSIPRIAHDVDTLADLRRIGLQAGPRTQVVLARLGAEAA